MKYNDLTPDEERVILRKGTEAPFSGAYWNFSGEGEYTCKRCDAVLFRSTDKFDSGCGWPSFDDEIPGAVRRQPDADGRRTEIVCARCGAHLGHVFEGEGLTPKNTRHCVNSISVNFAARAERPSTEQAIFAGGCFWGVEYHMRKLKGVLDAEVGYIGGTTVNPSYEDVCSHATGHAEAVRVTFDPAVVGFETVARLFFEIHDPTQVNRQGPDVGDQYRSEIFYLSESQREIGLKLIGELTAKGLKVATALTKATEFYAAEDYHQRYYERKGSMPYCHVYTKRF